jgi:hypothetical protein
MEFLDQINQLRTKIFKKVKPKLLRNQVINGPMLCELAESYVRALNGGKIPTIENAWDYMQASELERALKETTGEHEKKVDQVTKNKDMFPTNEENLK